MILAEDDMHTQITSVSRHHKIKKKCHNKKYNDWSKDPHWHSCRPSISLPSLPYYNDYSRNYPVMDTFYPGYDMLDDGPIPVPDDGIPEISPSKVKMKSYNNISNIILVIILLLVVFMFLSDRRCN